MSIFSFNLDYIRGTLGQSAVEAASYKNGVKMKDHTTGLSYNFSRKERVDYVFVLLPEGCPSIFGDSEYLWNQVEKHETEPRARKASITKIALQKEFTLEQNIQLLTKLCNRFYVQHNHIADVSIHDSQTENPHAHIEATLCPIQKDGMFGKKNRQLYKDETLEDMRECWEEINNEMFDSLGLSHLRISRHSHKKRKIDKEPQQHMGPAEARRLEKTGEPTERNAQVIIDQTLARLAEIRLQLKQIFFSIFANRIKTMAIHQNVVLPQVQNPHLLQTTLLSGVQQQRTAQFLQLQRLNAPKPKPSSGPSMGM